MYQHRQIDFMTRRANALLGVIRRKDPGSAAAWKWLDLALLWAVNNRCASLSLLIISEEQKILGIAA